MLKKFDLDKTVKVVVAVALGVIALVTTLQSELAGVVTPEEPVARSFNTAIYTEQGGAKMVVGSGGEIEVQSGATLDLQSGATSSADSLSITTLTLDSVAVSGPVTFGSATAVVSGTTIAHGLATTPTSAIVIASGVITTAPHVLRTDATNLTVGYITGGSAQTVYWLAGK